ncbi:Coproporphyrinogen III oxidase, aerobic [Winogradskyella psychrotolerans RS-3]|uniref:coproporphyrinogen oxidase n=2 Tax=Winogradskyella TaxID=286104 RepID=S7VPW5_9FLAO|nr:Coproporphyrinogen III oxidase, aerobic [Winogradskyella psychrotolerans RS-3]
MKLETLEKDHYYHIYNRGINGCNIYNSDENKRYFLELTGKYLDKKASISAYCLLDNHYHLLICVNCSTKEITQAFSNLFNAYSKAFNKQNNRTGSLFEKHFKRKKIRSEEYFKTVICYIHRNPFNDWENYKFSSYHYYLKEKSPPQLKIDKTYSLQLFDYLNNFKFVHKGYKNEDLQGFQNLAGLETNNLKGLKDSVSFKENNNMKDKFFKYIHQLQDTITSKLEEVDGKAKFQEDNWDRPEGGGGRTRVIENGAVFEKGGVNISGVHGKLPDSMQKYFGVEDADFFACGLSLVLHPTNPMVPTVHANWRYFEMYDKEGNIVDQWFGGGQDLTPYYLFEDDAKHFHQTCKTACDKHNPEFYPKYKSRCDDYFYNAHRNEGRGIGGLFFDYCKATDEMSMQNWYDFVTEVGDSFLEAYVPIVEKRKTLEYTKPQRDWQEIRRGRYVEFNLVHDKGTLFGLKTNGRIESILMSLPPHVQWVYDHQPEAGSEEEKLINVLQNPVDWI